MKIMILFAAILIVIGIVAFGYQGITYTSREKIINIGPVEITAEKTNILFLPPVVGVITLVGGIALLLMESRRK